MTVQWQWIEQAFEPKNFKDQTFFEGFNWGLFEKGDVVYLENYSGLDFRGELYAGVFIEQSNGNPIITILPAIAGHKVCNSGDVRNVKELTGKFWQKFLSS